GVHGVGDRVIGGARPRLDLEALPQRAARDRRDRGSDGRTGVQRQAGWLARIILRLIVARGCRSRVVERRSAERLTGDELAEPFAALIHEERLEARQAEIPLDVAPAGFTAEAELDAVSGVTSRLRRDLDNAVARARPVPGRRRRPFHDLDAPGAVGFQVG